MSQSRSDMPTARKSRAAVGAETARSAADVTDERYVWSGKVFPVFSIPNIDAEPWYIRLDVSNLAKDDYILYVENGSLFDTEAPFQVFPPRFESRETPEEGNPLILSSRFEFADDPPGNMIQIPPRSQINITMRLRKDCHARQDFRVTVYRHFGRTRDSDFHKGRPLSREFFQIPEADTCAVDVEVLTRTAHFRPWNLATRRSHFFWNLSFFGRPLFNRPEFQMQAQNRGSLPVSVKPRLYKAMGQERKAFGADAPEETLAPGQECVWTFPLWLRDAEEADQVAFESGVEVKNGGQKLKDMDAGEKAGATYHPYRSLPKDWLALLGILGFVGGGLVWLAWGVPVMVAPEVGVCFRFLGAKEGDIPKGVNVGDLALAELDENDKQIGESIRFQPDRFREEDNKKIYFCKFPARLMGRRWPFGWNAWSSQERHFMVIPSENFIAANKLKDDKNALNFHVNLAPPDRPLYGRFAPVFGSADFQRRDQIKLEVALSLPAEAKGALSATVNCKVGTPDGYRDLPPQSPIVKDGQVSPPVRFDLTNYVSPESSSEISVTVVTDNNFKGNITKMVQAGQTNTALTMDHFTLLTPAAAPAAPPPAPAQTQPAKDPKEKSGEEPAAPTKTTLTPDPKGTPQNSPPAIPGPVTGPAAGPISAAPTRNSAQPVKVDPTRYARPILRVPAVPPAQVALSPAPAAPPAMQDLILPSAKTITLPGAGNQTREVVLDADERLKLHIRRRSADSVEVDKTANILPGPHTMRLVGNNRVTLANDTMYVAAPDTQPEDREDNRTETGRDPIVDRLFMKGDATFKEYRDNINNRDWNLAKVSLMKAASAYKAILVARHSEADAVKVHYKLAWDAFEMSHLDPILTSVNPDECLANARQEAWAAAKMDSEHPTTYTKPIRLLIGKLYGAIPTGS